MEKRTGTPIVTVKGKNEKKLFRWKKGCKRKKREKMLLWEKSKTEG